MEYLCSKNYTKKLNKKVKKSQHIVEKQTGIRCTTTATKYLAICNAGLVNGLSEEIIFENFIKYGPLEKIVMLPGKSCAFVEYQTLESAINAYENINGQLNLAQDNKPLHLSFAETIPDNFSQHIGEKPPGLVIIDNFITEEEEQFMLNFIQFDQIEQGATLKHRQVKHYGYEFRYDINNVDKDRPLPERIPSKFSFLWERLKKCYNLDYKPDQLTINNYKPGQGIPPHVDTHSAFEDPLLSLSLGSAIVMDFRNDDGRHIPVVLPQRSLTIMSKECRYNWTHGITPRKLDIIPSENGLTVIQRNVRTSFTFRKVLRGECKCEYINKCDSYLKRQKENEVLHDSAATLEKLHVHDVYENIADHFSDTRHKPWPNVLDFINSFKLGSILVDVGCGNGKYLAYNKNIFNLGCDSSVSLTDVCKKRGFNVFTCNCLYIPVRDNTADGAVSIAVIHHLATEERRLRAIKELIRILQVGGQALIYVWAKDQNKDHHKSAYLKQDRKNRKMDLPQDNETKSIVVQNMSLPIHTNRTQFQHQDILVPWKLKGKEKEIKENEENVFLRFYHVFQAGELENLCKGLNNVDIIKSYYDEGNWCVILKKIQ